MELKQKSKQCVILLHEIYGINAHMQHYAHLLFEKGFDVYVPNLLDKNEPFTYNEEEAAYENFMQNIGFVRAKKRVEVLVEKLAQQYEKIRIVGFSIGATIGWLCSEHPAVQKVDCVYGSRIRRYVEVTPTAEVLLIYGDKEQSFDPQQVKEQLVAHKNVSVEIMSGSHGFADPYNANYQPKMTARVIELLLK